MNALFILIILTLCYWLTPVVLIFIALSRFKSRPDNARTLLIIAGVMLIIGIGFCGML
jgi:hypothetical protein